MRVGKTTQELRKVVFSVYWQFTRYLDDRPRQRVSGELSGLLRVGWRVATMLGEELERS